MVVWTDAHLSPALAPWLRATFAIEAAPLRELGLRDAEDAAIFAAARSAGAASTWRSMESKRLGFR